MTEAPSWATSVPSTPGVHTEPPSSTQWENLTQDQITALRDKLVQSIEQVITQDLTGGLSTSTPASDQLTQWADSLPILGPLISALTGGNVSSTDSSYTDLSNWFNFPSGTTDLTSYLQEFQADTSAFLDEVLTDLGLPTSEAAAFAAWLSGSAAGQRITNVSSAVIVNGTQELLESPNFQGAISIAGNGIWTWNGSTYYIVPGEIVDEPGSAQVTANGATQALTTEPAEDIPLGQPIDYSVHVCAVGLTGNGDLLQLVAIPWIGNVAQTPIVLASGGAPTGSTAGWTNPPSGATAGVLSGVYKPEVGSGITAVSMQVIVTNAALSGTVYFSAASEELTGGLINDLVNEAAAGQQATATYYTALGTAATQVLGGNWPAGFTTAANAWTAYQAAESGVDSAEYITFHQLLQMVGINTNNGLMNVGNVSSGTGLGTLSDDWNQVVGFWDHLLGVGNDPTTAQVKNTSVASVGSNANLGTDVSAAQASAAGAQTTASNAGSAAAQGQNYIAQLLGYYRIIFGDALHLTYAKGNVNDAPGTIWTGGGIGNGLPTWYSAWNGALILEGLIKSAAAPTDSAPTTGDVIQANTAAANTASSNASLAAAANQATNSAINMALSGVASTSASAVQTNLGAIPAGNVVGATGANVSFGSVGGGNQAGGSSSNSTATWSDTILSTDLSVKAIVWHTRAAGSSYTSSVTCGGVAMTLVSSVTSSQIGSSVLTMEVWDLKSPGSGTKTFVANVSAGGGLAVYIGGNSLSYLSSKIVSCTPNSGGNNANPSMSASSAAGRMVIGAFAVISSGTPTLTAYSQTQRFNTTGSGVSLVLGDAAGAASVGFSVHCAVATNQWVGMTIDISN